MHRIFGPAALLVIAVIAVGVVQEGGAPLAADVAGFLFIATVIFGVPLAIMRFAWVQTHGTRPVEPHPVGRSESPHRAATHPVANRPAAEPPRRAA